MKSVMFGLSLFLCFSLPGAGQDPAPASTTALETQIRRLRQEMEDAHRQYRRQIQALEEEIRLLREAQEASAAAEEVSAEGILPPLPAAPPRGNAMNPAVSVIPDFTAMAGDDPAWTAGDPIQLRELELSFSASIDPFASAFATVALHKHGHSHDLEERFHAAHADHEDHEEEGEGYEAEIEEAYAVFPGLPGGFSLKFGKFFSAFGKENQAHLHTWFQADRPLAFSLLGGEGINEMGVSLNRLLPTPWASDVTVEITGGRDGSLFEGRRADLAYLVAWRNFWDCTDNANLEAQVSLMGGKNGERGTTRLGNLSFTYRYKPLASAKRESLLWRTEYVAKRFGSREEYDGEVHRLTDRSEGLFSYIDWQFARGWFIGLRGDWVDHEYADLEDKGGALALTWFPSEFQKWRLQLQRTSYGGLGVRDALVLQYGFSLGPHGAHPF